MHNFYRQNKNDVIVLQEDLWNQMIDRFSLEFSGENLNLACGPDYKEGWVNLDGDKTKKADVYCDLDSESVCLPLENERFDLILASHIFEHIWYLPQLKQECLRVLKVGGKLLAVVPEASSPDAWGDDTHCRAFQKSSFNDTFWPNMELEGLMYVNLQHPSSDIMGDFIWLVGCLVRTL